MHKLLEPERLQAENSLLRALCTDSLRVLREVKASGYDLGADTKLIGALNFALRYMDEAVGIVGGSGKPTI